MKRVGVYHPDNGLRVINAKVLALDRRARDGWNTALAPETFLSLSESIQGRNVVRATLFQDPDEGPHQGLGDG
jgi:hypothetical protein